MSSLQGSVMFLITGSGRETILLNRGTLIKNDQHAINQTDQTKTMRQVVADGLPSTDERVVLAPA